MNIFECILYNCLRVRVSTNQCGFVKGVSTTDAIHAALLLIEKHRQKNQPLHVAFLYLEKVFDRVQPELMWKVLRDHSVPEVFVR